MNREVIFQLCYQSAKAIRNYPFNDRRVCVYRHLRWKRKDEKVVQRIDKDIKLKKAYKYGLIGR